MLKQILSILLLILFAAPSSFGQFYYYDDKYMDNDRLFEAGISLGLMQGVTDVGSRKGNALSPSYYDWKSAKLNAGIHCTFMYQSTFEGRLQLTKGIVAGKDANSNSNYVKQRNLNYKSNIFELSLTAAIHPIMFLNLDYLPAISPYVIAGFGIFSFYPKAQYKGEWIPLRAVNTEGQNSELYPNRKQYSLRAISLPVGGGLKYEFNGQCNIRFEMMYRFTSTDYIDDASTTYPDRSLSPIDRDRILSHRYMELYPRINRTGQKRGDQSNKDGFFTINLMAGYVVGREKRKYGKSR